MIRLVVFVLMMLLLPVILVVVVILVLVLVLVLVLILVLKMCRVMSNLDMVGRIKIFDSSSVPQDLSNSFVEFRLVLPNWAVELVS